MVDLHTYGKFRSERSMVRWIRDFLLYDKGTLVLICIVIMNNDRRCLIRLVNSELSVDGAVCRRQSEKRVLRFRRRLDQLIVSGLGQRNLHRLVRFDLKYVLLSGQTAVGLYVLGASLNDKLVLHVILAVVIRNITGHEFFHFEHILTIVVFDLNLLGVISRKFECLRICAGDHVLDFQILTIDLLLSVRRLFFNGICTCRDPPEHCLRIVWVAIECQRRITLRRSKLDEIAACIKTTVLAEVILDRKVKDRSIWSNRTVHLLFDRDIARSRRRIILSVLVIDSDRLILAIGNTIRTVRSGIGISYEGIVASGSCVRVLLDDRVLTCRNIVEDISAGRNIFVGKCLCVSERTQDRKLQVVQICELSRVNCSGTILVIVIGKCERLVYRELTLLHIVLVDDINILSVFVQSNILGGLIRSRSEGIARHSDICVVTGIVLVTNLGYRICRVRIQSVDREHVFSCTGTLRACIVVDREYVFLRTERTVLILNVLIALFHRESEFFSFKITEVFLLTGLDHTGREFDIDILLDIQGEFAVNVYCLELIDQRRVDIIVVSEDDLIRSHDRSAHLYFFRQEGKSSYVIR